MRNLVLTLMGLLMAGAAQASAPQYSYSQCVDIVYTEAGAKNKEAADTCQERRDTAFVNCLTQEYSNLKSFKTFATNKALCAQRYPNGPTKEELLCGMRLESVGFEKNWALSLCKWTTRNSIQNCIVINAGNARTDVQKDALVRSCYNQDAVGELTETGVNRVELERQRKAAEEARRVEEQRRQEAARREAERARIEAERSRIELENKRQAAEAEARRQAEEQKRKDQERAAEQNRPKAPPAPAPVPPAKPVPVVTQPVPVKPAPPVVVEQPKKETPKAEVPKVEAPKTQTPKAEVPKPTPPKAQQPVPAVPSQPSESDTAKDQTEKEPAKDNSGATPATEDGVIVDLPLFE